MLFLLLSPLLVRLLPKELQKEITILFRHR